MSTKRTTSLDEPGWTAADGRRLHIVTFGCQMNRYDSELVEGRFRRAGYSTTEDMQSADVVLFMRFLC